MKSMKLVRLTFIVFLGLGLMISMGCAKKEEEEPEETPAMEESAAEEPKTELPAPVREVVDAYFPDAEIDFVEVVDEDGITLYDIEFKADRGEIELAADGTIIDVVTIVTMEDLPEAAALAIQKATEGMTIKRLEKAEVHSEIMREGETAAIVMLEAFKYVYEAEIEQDGRTGEIAVDSEGNIVEELKWDEE